MNRPQIAFDSAKVRDAVRAGLASDSDIMRQLKRAGIEYDQRIGQVHVLKEHASDIEFSMDSSGAFSYDAQPELVTNSNAGIPAYLTNYFDPEVVRVLLTPMKAAQIAGGEVQKGDWLTESATFISLEQVGETSAYSDWSNNGMAKVNVNFPTRQSFIFQSIANWGEREAEKYGLARVSYANEVQGAVNLALAKFQNKSYFFGISGIKCYGLLNDPSLPPSLSASAAWSTLTGDQVYEQVRLIYERLVFQSRGLVDASTQMTLALPPSVETSLHKTNQYNVNVYDQIKHNFPNISIQSAVEYETSSGNLVQLIAHGLEGKRTVECAYNLKMRAHAVIPSLSSWAQKRSAGTFGTVFYRPFLVASMLGV
jgi:hypothetical protein